MVELGPRCTGSMKGTSTERPLGALSLAEAWRLGGFLVGGAVLSWLGLGIGLALTLTLTLTP